MKFGLKGKIFIIVSILYLTFMVMAGWRLKDNYQEYKYAEVVSEKIHLLELVSNFVHESQKERGLTAGFLGGATDLSTLENQRKEADGHADKLKGILKSDQVAPEMKEMLFAGLEEIKGTREKVNGKSIGAPEAIGSYTGVVTKMLSLYPTIAETSVLKDLASRVRTMAILESAKENAGRLRANLNNILGSNQPLSQQQYRTIIDLNAGISANLQSPALYLSPASKTGLGVSLNSAEWKTVQIVFQDVLLKAEKGEYGHDSKVFFKTITTFIDGLGELVDTESGFIGQITEEIKSSSQQQLFLLVATVFLSGIIIIIGVMLFVRSLIGTVDRVINDLNDNSLQVNSAAQQISASSEELSQAATEQAASLEQTAASIEELTSMVQKNTENAGRTAEISNQSRNSAVKGKKTVEEMLHAIDDISASNTTIMQQIDESNSEISIIVNVISEIGEKTKVINDIVFQTKLLSFNASVEAARAGEHGKGFAVVAEEVGNLAQMSGNAAKEISTMLEESVRKVEGIVERSKTKIQGLMDDGKLKVETGIRVAKGCDEVLNEIVENVNLVSQMAREISTASNEQAQGVREISKAMSQLDQMTQTNASTSEESAASAEELTAQSVSLQKVVQVLIEIVKGETTDSNFNINQDPAHSGAFKGQTSGNGVVVKLINRDRDRKKA